MLGITKSFKKEPGPDFLKSSRDEQKDFSQMQATVSQAVDHICKYFLSLNTKLIRQEKQLHGVIQRRKQDLENMEQYFETVAKCQKQTAEIANQNLQRHALYPAVLAVDALTELIRDITEQSESVIDCQTNNNCSFKKLRTTISQALKVAESKKDGLGIQNIRPEKGENLDKDKHVIVNAVSTDQVDDHKKICETLSEGLVYQRQVLKPAKVSVYRFKEK